MYLCKNRFDDVKCAIKEVPVYLERKSGVEPLALLKDHRAYREVVITALLNSDFVIRYFESWIELPDDKMLAKLRT